MRPPPLNQRADKDEFPLMAIMGCSMACAAHGYAVTGCMPYSGYMIVWMGMAEDVDSAGYFAGFLVAGFMFGRIFTAFLWGVASDRVGRKPVILVSVFSFVVFQLTFGFSTSFTMVGPSVVRALAPLHTRAHPHPLSHTHAP